MPIFNCNAKQNECWLTGLPQCQLGSLIFRHFGFRNGYLVVSVMQLWKQFQITTYNEIFIPNFQSHIIINQILSFKLSTSMNTIFQQTSSTQNSSWPFQQLQGPFLINRRYSKCAYYKIANNWTEVEQMKFCIYLYKNGDKLLSSSKVERWEMFKTMARFIKTRNFNQCKSFYSRMIKKYSNISKYVDNIRENYSNLEKMIQEGLLQLSWIEEQCKKTGKQQHKIYKQALSTDINYQVQRKETKGTIPKICSMPSGLLKIFYPEIARVEEKQMMVIECQQLFNSWLFKVNQLANYQ